VEPCIFSAWGSGYSIGLFWAKNRKLMLTIWMFFTVKSVRLDFLNLSQWTTTYLSSFPSPSSLRAFFCYKKSAKEIASVLSFLSKHLRWQILALVDQTTVTLP
jgi:hypothetical protein